MVLDTEALLREDIRKADFKLRAARLRLEVYNYLRAAAPEYPSLTLYRCLVADEYEAIKQQLFAEPEMWAKIEGLAEKHLSPVAGNGQPVRMDYDPNKTPSFNLISKIRWGTDDEKHDLAFWLEKWFGL